MEKHTQAGTEFNEKLDVLQKEIQPALYEQNLKEIVIYEKLLEMEEQINKLTDEAEKK